MTMTHYRLFALAVAAAATISCPALAYDTSSGSTRVAAPDLSSFNGEMQAAAAAACDNSTLPGKQGGGKIARYKITYIYALTEYNTGTCKANGKGSWTINSQQKCDKTNCGKITLGTLTGLHLGNGDCPDHVYNFAALCYTWTQYNDAKIKDSIGATWHPPTLPDQNYTFPISVPIVYPTSETVEFDGWDPQGYGKWKQTLHNDKDPSFDWSLNTVQETDAGGNPSTDKCWCKGSKYDPFYKITGGTWYPDDKGVWADDYVGWGATYIKYYRTKRRAPCGTTLPQQMQFQATNINKGWKDYGPVNILGSSFTYTTLTSLRAKHSKTETFEPMPVKTQLACTKIKWPTTPENFVLASLITVDDPRPVAAAVEAIQHASGQVITYEDPPIVHTSQTTPMVSGGNGDNALLMPKGGSLRFQLPASGSRADVEQSLEAMVANYNASRGAATFAVSHNDVIHVVPDKAMNDEGRLVPIVPVLDTKVTIDAKPRPAMELYGAILGAVSRASGQQVGPGIIPVNGLRTHIVDVGANNEPARAVLARMIAATGLKMSWRLLYDPGTKDYALNMALID
jgi:hypothetical protein